MEGYEKRGLAFELYARLRDMEAVRLELEGSHGLKVAARTLYRWRDEGAWDEELRPPGRKELMLRDLLDVIERLQGRLSSGAPINPQDVYAYSSLLNTFFNLSRKFSMKKIVAGKAPDAAGAEAVMRDQR